MRSVMPRLCAGGAGVKASPLMAGCSRRRKLINQVATARPFSSEKYVLDELLQKEQDAKRQMLAEEINKAKAFQGTLKEDEAYKWYFEGDHLDEKSELVIPELHLEPFGSKRRYRFGITEEMMDEVGASETVRRVLDARNACQRERRQIIYKHTANPLRRHEFDTGSSEVQVVGMTLQIRNLSNHMKNNIKDQVTKRALQQLIGRRRRMMLHLRRTKPFKYVQCLKMMSIEPVNPREDAVVPGYEPSDEKNSRIPKKTGL